MTWYLYLRSSSDCHPPILYLIFDGTLRRTIQRRLFHREFISLNHFLNFSFMTQNKAACPRDRPFDSYHTCQPIIFCTTGPLDKVSSYFILDEGKRLFRVNHQKLPEEGGGTCLLSSSDLDFLPTLMFGLRYLLGKIENKVSRSFSPGLFFTLIGGYFRYFFSVPV
ncbi:hypothetical protein BCR42DRAFT_388010 [Absidia repens]|uniref:Uncharacterized protein n=1 Tax=Absidia repens TaxID=90262 RepID=A0A1X2IWL1_9FUNG|nr:hypothetical protein BCR42DRAFT_388010 [Absidia repens]